MKYKRKFETNSLKVRMMCRMCGVTSFARVDCFYTGSHPRCCGDLMLIAGSEKRDVHGLRSRGCIIDPVNEYLNQYPAILKNFPIAS